MNPADATPRGRAPLVMMVVGLALLAGAALATAQWIIHQREGQLLDELEQRMALVLEGQAATLAGWLADRREAVERFAAEPAARLLAAERVDGGAPPDAELTHLQSRLNAFARERATGGAWLLSADAAPLATSAEAPPPDDALRQLAREVAASTETRTIERQGDEPRALIAAPLHPLEVLPDQAAAPVGALVAALPLAERRRALESTRHLGLAGERLDWLTADGDAAPPALQALDGGRRYRLERTVEGTPWRLALTVEGEAARAPLAPFAATVHLAAALLTTLAAALLVVVWLRQRGEGNRALAAQYRRLAETMERQNRLIEEINSAVGEHISLKGLDGRYRYVNHAFAGALGRSVEGIEGSRDAELFNSRDARRLEELDRLTLEQGETLHAAATLRIGGGMRHFELSKTPFSGPGGEREGIVTVARDVTDLIEQKRRSEMLLKQTTTAIGYLSEAADLPHFAGQARMVGKVAVGIAKRLKLPQEAISTLEIAANLCHVGKLSLPPAVRFKEGRFTAEEFELMKEQMADADRLLGEIEFGLPVREAVVQMYERLDGSGYPSGLIGDDITQEARILGVANVFVAHINARPYREALSVESALEYLRGHPGQFDVEVVDALVRLVDETRTKGRG